jgi:dihydroorotate dehydrogenase electron transfer subunit
MKQMACRIESVRPVAENIHVLTFTWGDISRTIRAGQFVNIKVDETTVPLLRRPYSVYHTHGDQVDLIFNIVGKGSAALARRRPGESIDVLGPLGVPFGLEREDYTTAILIAGGLGVAPMPVATVALRRLGKGIVTLLGARTASHIVDAHLDNVRIATDDGTRGLRGTVVDLARELLTDGGAHRRRIFACGPTAMLRALATLAIERAIPCEVSMEGPMACGFGICQGCPVELVGDEKRYALMCKDGPTFDVTRIKF